MTDVYEPTVRREGNVTHIFRDSNWETPEFIRYRDPKTRKEFARYNWVDENPPPLGWVADEQF
ncbi:MAG: hypothetical protein Q8R13_02810 [bacterium]|nr:hypothetical protein [bacterium]MDZ4296331.1 hypothetical protein [Patescibacteria group bacterium]